MCKLYCRVYAHYTVQDLVNYLIFFIISDRAETPRVIKPISFCNLPYVILLVMFLVPMKIKNQYEINRLLSIRICLKRYFTAK